MAVKGGKSYVYIDNANGDSELYEGSDGEARNVVLPGERFEADSYVCGHCQRLVIKNPQRVRPREWCRRCNRYLCEKPCNAGENCYDIQRMIELQQRYPDVDVLARDEQMRPTFDLDELIARHTPR